MLYEAFSSGSLNNIQYLHNPCHEMSDKKYDFIIKNLKSIAQVPRNRRLRTNQNGYFTLEDNHLLVPLKRTIYGEGRRNLARDIDSLLLEIQSQVKLLLSSKHLDEDNGSNITNDESKNLGSDDKQNIIEQLSHIHRELLRSITGFENLKSTYSSDIWMVSEMEHAVDIVRSCMKKIEQKIPDVAENIPPVFLENNSQ